MTSIDDRADLRKCCEAICKANSSTACAALCERDDFRKVVGGPLCPHALDVWHRQAGAALAYDPVRAAFVADAQFLLSEAVGLDFDAERDAAILEEVKERFEKTLARHRKLNTGEES